MDAIRSKSTQQPLHHPGPLHTQQLVPKPKSLGKARASEDFFDIPLRDYPVARPATSPSPLIILSARAQAADATDSLKSPISLPPTGNLTSEPLPWRKSLGDTATISVNWLGLLTGVQHQVKNRLSEWLKKAWKAQCEQRHRDACDLYTVIEGACHDYRLDPWTVFFGEQGGFRDSNPLFLALDGTNNASVVCLLMGVAERCVQTESRITLWSFLSETSWADSYDSHLACEHRRHHWLVRHGLRATQALTQGDDVLACQVIREMACVADIQVHKRHYLCYRVGKKTVSHIGPDFVPWQLARRQGCTEAFDLLAAMAPRSHRQFLRQTSQTLRSAQLSRQI